MKRSINLFLMIVVALMLAPSRQTFAQGDGPQYTLGTAFNYQGQLKKNGSPQNGTCDFDFSVWDAVSGGKQQGRGKSVIGVNVVNGLFTVQLDFGELKSNARWLLIEVQCKGDSAFTSVSPRQALGVTATNATNAQNATNSSNFIQNTTTEQSTANFNISGNGTVGGILSAPNLGIGTTGPRSTLHVKGTGWFAGDETPLLPAAGKGVAVGFLSRLDAGYLFAYDYAERAPKNLLLNNTGGNVGIGTIEPQMKLTVQTAPENYGLVHTDGNVVFGTWVGAGSSGGDSGWFGTKSNHPLRFFTNNGSAAMTINTSGNVGIGTTISPAAKLGVDGGSSEAIFAVSLDRDGVIGQTWAAHTNSIAGVSGISKGEGGIGVIGEANKGNAYGVYGRSESASGVGVTGEANASNAWGVYGKSESGVGVYGRSASGYAMYADGNAAQARDKSGLVKAMLYVKEDGKIARCYNAIKNLSSELCGFDVRRLDLGVYRVEFGFQVRDRFISVTAVGPVINVDGAPAATGASVDVFNGLEGVDIVTYYVTKRSGLTNSSFYIIVY